MKEEALNSNMRNEIRNPTDRIEKDGGQPDATTIWKKESANTNTIFDSNMSNDSCTTALTDK